jgi:proliferating cell nuclear antigen PCNA
MVKIVITDKSKTNKLLTILKNLKSICVHANFQFTENGLYSQGMDSSHASLYELQITKEWFSEYELDQDILIGLNTEMLFKAMNCVDDGQTVELATSKKGDKFILKLIDGKYNKDFEIPIMDIDEEQLEIPDAEWEVDIKMNSKDFGEMIRQLSTWGDNLNVKCSEDISGLKFQSSGDNGKMTVDVKDEDINLMEMVEDCELNLDYSLSFMEMFSLFTKLNPEINVHYGIDKPMKVEFDLSDWKDKLNEEENEDAQWKFENSIKFFAAPKVEDF